MITKKSLSSTVNVELTSQVGHALSATGVPAVNAYELGRLVFLKSPAANAPTTTKREHKRLIAVLTSVGLLTPVGDSGAFVLFGRSSAAPAEIACCIDPFAYVSHLSAMEHHGLTDRFPHILYLTTPPAADWRRQAEAKMQKDLGDGYERYKASGLPRLTRSALSTIGHASVHVQERSQMGAFRLVSDTPLRVATIGRTFLDMLREPKLCGGMQHVIDIYRNDAKRYFRLILDELERHGKPIDKIRAGYILSAVCELESPVFTAWKGLAQRGGSRKLDPDAEYSAEYSAEWQLSINVPSLIKQGNESDEL